MTSIYLAGKIAKNDWRSFRGVWDPQYYDRPPVKWDWPVVRNAVHGMDLVGPFFISCDHGCAHGPDSHGISAGDDIENAFSGPSRPEVTRLCFDAIKRADIFFAWFDQEKGCEQAHITAYGTLVELGYAKALSKTVVVASSMDIRTAFSTWDTDHGGLIHEGNPLGDIWFAIHAATDFIIAEDPWEALKGVADIYTVNLESPLEEAFWKAHIATQHPSLNGLVTQHEVQTNSGLYRLDFALPAKRLGFEMDGYTYHSDRNAWAKDRRRDLALSAAGWRIHRFDGDMIRASAQETVKIAAQIAEAT